MLELFKKLLEQFRTLKREREEKNEIFQNHDCSLISTISIWVNRFSKKKIKIKIMTNLNGCANRMFEHICLELIFTLFRKWHSLSMDQPTVEPLDSLNNIFNQLKFINQIKFTSDQIDMKG